MESLNEYGCVVVRFRSCRFFRQSFPEGRCHAWSPSFVCFVVLAQFVAVVRRQDAAFAGSPRTAWPGPKPGDAACRASRAEETFGGHGDALGE